MLLCIVAKEEGHDYNALYVIYEGHEMAKCDYCGTEVPFFNIERECADCQKNFQDLVQQFTQERRAFLEAILHEYDTRIPEMVDRRLVEIRTTLEQTKQYTLYVKHYLPVDAQVETLTTADVFDVEPLNVYGAAGWRVVSFVPKTLGLGLTNEANNLMSTKSWGGGIGGNVIGVYDVLELVVTTETLQYARTGLEHSIRQSNPPPNINPEYVALKLLSAPGKTKKDLVPLAALAQQTPEAISSQITLPTILGYRLLKTNALFFQQKLNTYGYTTVIEAPIQDEWYTGILRD